VENRTYFWCLRHVEFGIGNTNDAAQYLHRYPFCESTKHSKPIKKVLVNAVGFGGGNAVSILLTL
jgi:3-oxoacyl-(acyl-carrier-protein) synthase